MKKKLMLLSAIILVSAPSFSAATTEEISTKKTSKIISNITGTVEYKAELFGTKSEDVSRSYTETYEATGFDTETVQTKDDVGTLKTTDFLNSDSNDEEPNATVTLGAKLFENYDLKLNLKANYDSDEDDTGNNTTPSDETNAYESSTLSLSRTWDDMYLEWKTDLDLDNDTFFSALMQDSSFIVRKKIGKVEGQLKATKFTDSDNKGKYGIDKESSDNYIKVTPNEKLTLTFRPYDADWKTGKEFVNNNLNRNYYIADASATGTDSSYDYYDTYSSVNLADSFDNFLPKDETPLSAIELEYKAGKVRYFGKLNTEFVDSSKTNTETVEDVGTTTVVYKPTEKNSIEYKAYNSTALQLGAEINLNKNTKIVATSLMRNWSPEYTGTVESIDYTDINNPVATKNVTNEEYTNSYFALNVYGETKVSKLKIEAELDYRSENNSADNSYKTTVTGVTDPTTDTSGNDETSNTMLGLFTKASYEGVKWATPYASFKYTNKSLDYTQNTEYKLTQEKESVDFSETYDKLELALGADKTIDALTVGLEFKVVSEKYGEAKQTSTYTDASAATAYIEKYTKVSSEEKLDLSTLATLKIAYKF